jgi:hypothetical protein
MLLARPERFELPTRWFVGRSIDCRAFTFQQLVALAIYKPSMSTPHPDHNRAGRGAISAHDKIPGVASALDNGAAAGPAED